MGRAEVLQGVRQMRFEGLLERHERGELSQEEAAEMLGVSERTFRRWRDRLRDEGPEGLRDRRIGKPSSRRAAAAEIPRMVGLYEEHYAGFTVKHFHEQLQKRHHYQLGYTVTRLAFAGGGPGAAGAAALGASQEAAAAADGGHDAAPKPALAKAGDASRFAWLPGDDRQYDLVVTLDVATSAIYSGFIVEEEGTASRFRALAEVIDQHGCGDHATIAHPLSGRPTRLPCASGRRLARTRRYRDLIFVKPRFDAFKAASLNRNDGDQVQQTNGALLAVRITGELVPALPLTPGFWRLACRRTSSSHLSVMTDLNKQGCYDRMTDDLFKLTGQEPISMHDFVKLHAADFTRSRKSGNSPVHNAR